MANKKQITLNNEVHGALLYIKEISVMRYSAVWINKIKITLLTKLKLKMKVFLLSYRVFCRRIRKYLFFSLSLQNLAFLLFVFS